MIFPHENLFLPNFKAGSGIPKMMKTDNPKLDCTSFFGFILMEEHQIYGNQSYSVSSSTSKQADEKFIKLLKMSGGAEKAHA